MMACRKESGSSVGQQYKTSFCAVVARPGFLLPGLKQVQNHVAIENEIRGDQALKTKSDLSSLSFLRKITSFYHKN